MMPSISWRWSVENVCAAGGSAAGTVCADGVCADASGANSIAAAIEIARRRVKIMSMFLCDSLTYSKRIGFQVLIEDDDIVGADPARRSDREALLSPRRKFARGLIVAAGESRLCRCEIGVG